MGRMNELPLFTADDFNGHVFFSFVVVTFEHLAEAAFAERFEHLVSVGDVVFVYLLIGGVLVLVVFHARCLYFICLEAQKPNLRVLVYFVSFELGQLITV